MNIDTTFLRRCMASLEWAEATLKLLPAFISDAKALADVIAGVEG